MFKVSGLYSNNMILQRNKENLIYGAAEPNETVLVSVINGSNEAEWKGQCNADTNGAWEVIIAPRKEGGPYIISVKGNKDEITINNVLFGDVYVLGGQSNMELTIGMIPDANKETLAMANEPDIRMFPVPHEYDFSESPRILNQIDWNPATPEYIAEFSAIGYYFAKEKQKKDGIPVGLIQTAVGGAPVEALMSKDNILKQAQIIRDTIKPEGGCHHDKHRGCIFCYEKLFDKVSDLNYPKKTVEEDLKRAAKWHDDIDKADKGLIDEWFSYEWENDEAECKYNAPGFFVNTKYENWFGTLWLQKTFYVSEKHAGKEALLSLGTLVDFDTTYVNGTFVGHTDYRYPQRRYTVPAGVIKPGRNTVTVRLGMDGNIGGFLPDMPYNIKFEADICSRGSCSSGGCSSCDNVVCKGDSCCRKKPNTETIEISLTGEWKLREGAKAEKLDGETYFIWYPSALYNSMIAPLRGLGADAILYYQGESNGDRAEYYDVLFKAMINEWRELLSGEATPIYYSELAVYFGDLPSYEGDVYADLREVQRRVESEIDDAHLIHITELPAPYNELHPQNKADVARMFYESYLKNN